MAQLRWQEPADGSDTLAIAQIRWRRTNGSELHQPKITKWVQNLPESGARTHPRSQGKDLQRQAWRWALAQRAGDGSLPSGREIADQFGRHERWGRMVKRSGTARELSSGHSELALRLVEQQSSPAAGE